MGKRLLAVMIIALLVPAVFAQEYDPALLVETGQTAAENLSALCELQGYAELYTSDQELLSLIGGWGGDWTKPENRRRAAVASIPREAVAQLMPLVPGLAMTNAVQDTLRGDMVSGLSHGASALLTACLIAGGALLSPALIRLIFGGGL